MLGRGADRSLVRAILSGIALAAACAAPAAAHAPVEPSSSSVASTFSPPVAEAPPLPLETPVRWSLGDAAPPLERRTTDDETADDRTRLARSFDDATFDDATFDGGVAAVSTLPMPSPMSSPMDSPMGSPLGPRRGGLSLEQQLADMQLQLGALQQRLVQDEIEIGRLRSTDVPHADRLASQPSYPKVRLTGVLQAEAGWFGQGASSVATFGDLQDVAGVRRARLAAVGDVAKNLSYLMEVDFGGPARPNIMDMWLDLHDVPLVGNIRVGQWRQPFHMDVQTSVRELPFLETSTSAALALNRQIGIGFHDSREDGLATWAASVFRFPTDAYGDIGSPIGVGRIGDRGYGMSVRATGLAWYEEQGPLVHLGGGFAHLAPGERLIGYRATPEFGGPFIGPQGNLPSVPFFAETGPLDAAEIQLYGAELGWRFGSFYGQSEAVYSVVHDAVGGTVVLPGVYAQCAYLLTGEMRPYNQTAGVFGRVDPRHDFGPDGIGAWEFAVRYSYLDLNAQTSNGPTHPGGRLSDLTCGLNWYLNSHAKLQINYIRAFTDRQVHGESATNILALRAQVDF